MTINIDLGWPAFWLFMCLWVWIDHTQYIAGHETTFFAHKTPEEKRIREATIKKLEGKP